MAYTVEAVLFKWHLSIWLDRFFGVVPNQPDAVTVALFPAQLIGELQQQCAR
jgi:hypothetical protein